MTAANNWARRRWLNFRQGHSYYLIFAMSFANFILIFYRLLVERVETLSDLFSDLWVFVAVFVAFYVPAAILIGHWHHKTQVKIETELWHNQDPVMAKWFRLLIDIHTGKATQEEIAQTRNFLKSIEEGKSYKEFTDDKNSL